MAAHPAGSIQSQHWAAVQDLQTGLRNGVSEADRQPQTQAPPGNCAIWANGDNASVERLKGFRPHAPCRSRPMGAVNGFEKLPIP
jgi:hypothetical protein